MELKQIKELMAAMGRTGIKKISLKKEDCELLIEREEYPSGRSTEPQFDQMEDGFKMSCDKSRAEHALSRGSEMPTRDFVTPTAYVESKEEDGKKIFVTSPMVGTIYTSPSPEDAPFVKIGDKVDRNTVVCIVEAMKVMNEIKANAVGIITEIFVENGHPVEFGTKLFRIVE